LLSPLYVAVIGCVPATRDDVDKVVVALLSVLVPREIPLSKNVTVPVGVAEPVVWVTVAVKVTCCPKTDGFGLEVRLVVEAVGSTLKDTALEALLSNAGFPP
jgi:hypothetical protein